MNETFDIIKTFTRVVSRDELHFPDYQELELNDGMLTVHVTDQSLELPPECSAEVNALLGPAGLGNLEVVYVHSAGDIDLMVGE